jgi:hypothetical protein
LKNIYPWDCCFLLNAYFFPSSCKPFKLDLCLNFYIHLYLVDFFFSCSFVNCRSLFWGLKFDQHTFDIDGEFIISRVVFKSQQNVSSLCLNDDMNCTFRWCVLVCTCTFSSTTFFIPCLCLVRTTLW